MFYPYASGYVEYIPAIYNADIVCVTKLKEEKSRWLPPKIWIIILASSNIDDWGSLIQFQNGHQQHRN